MNKKELIQSVADSADVSQKVAGDVMDAVFDTFAQGLAEGEKITVQGFGSFTPKVRDARTGRNPQTGEAMEIPETTVVSFKASTVLKKTVNE